MTKHILNLLILLKIGFYIRLRRLFPLFRIRISWKNFFWSYTTINTWTEKKNAWKERKRENKKRNNRGGKIKRKEGWWKNQKGKMKRRKKEKEKIGVKRKRNWNVLIIVFIKYLLFKMSRIDMFFFLYFFFKILQNSVF